MKDPDAIAAIVTTLRRVYGDNAARMMLSKGMTLLTLIETMFSSELSNRDAVRLILRAMDDFAISPSIGSVAHLKYIYESPSSFYVVDMEIVTPHGTLSSTDVWLRLPD